jgi:hypothetical protein
VLAVSVPAMRSARLQSRRRSGEPRLLTRGPKATDRRSSIAESRVRAQGGDGRPLACAQFGERRAYRFLAVFFAAFLAFFAIRFLPPLHKGVRPGPRGPPGVFRRLHSGTTDRTRVPSVWLRVRTRVARTWVVTGARPPGCSGASGDRARVVVRTASTASSRSSWRPSSQLSSPCVLLECRAQHATTFSSSQQVG